MKIMISIRIRNILIFITALLQFGFCSAQKPESNVPSAGGLDLTIQAKKIYIDKLGYYYFVNLKNEILRYNPQLNLTYRYSNDRLGEVTLLDVSNPLKLLAFYGDYQIVVSLDNTLTETARYDLHSMNFEDISAVGLSSDNNLWIYDPVNFQLKKISESGQLIQESYSLVSENLEDINPTFLKELKNKVYLYDHNSGLHVFDNYGQYIKSYKDLADLDHLQILDAENILCHKDGNLFVYSVKWLNSRNAELNEFLAMRLVLVDFYLWDQKINFLYKNGIKIHHLK